MAQVAVDPYMARLTRVTLTWVLVALVLFPVLAVLGFLMRTLQAGFLPDVAPEWFYAILTLHGLGMVGLWFVAGMAGMGVLLARYVRPTVGVSWIAYDWDESRQQFDHPAMIAAAGDGRLVRLLVGGVV